ncbi:MAG: NAD(P)H-dependent oxidoreductase [Acidimicrobiia bacterium]|nr:NAD(P)H-dependent oxidoreductase [Acidimicrobiia bacterium]
MKVLLVDAFPPDSPDRGLVDTAVATLRAGTHDVEHVTLPGGPFATFMSADERRAYHGDEPLISPETEAAAAAVQRADALLFCYPTTTFTVPAVLKSWMERVLVPGVAFVFDDKERVRPGMTNIRRIGMITATDHDARTTRQARDAGRRTILWNLRLSCHRFCRRTFVSVAADSGDDEPVRRALQRW